MSGAAAEDTGVPLAPNGTTERQTGPANDGPRRSRVPALAALAGLALTAAAFAGSRALAVRALRNTVEADAAVRAGIIQDALGRAVAAAEAPRWFFLGSRWVEPAEFEAFAGPLLAEQASFRDLSWAPRITREQRSALERAAEAQGLGPLRIFEYDASGHPIPAADRPVHYPVLYSAARPGEPGLPVGLDLGADSDCLEALVADQPVTHTAPPGREGPSPLDDPAVALLIVPTPGSGIEPGALGAAGPVNAGYSIARVDLDRLVHDALDPTPPQGLPFTLVDSEALAGAEPLYRWEARRNGRVSRLPFALHAPAVRSALRAGDREWTMVVQPNDAFVRRNASHAFLFVPPIGLLVVVALSLSLRATCASRALMRWEETRHREALARSEALHRTLVESAPDAIAVTDARGRIVSGNESLARMHGLAGASEAIGRPLGEMVAPEDRPTLARAGEEALAEGRSRTVAVHLCRIDGSMLAADVTLAPLPGESGVGQLMAIGRDTTERTRAEEALRASERRFREIADFLPLVIYECDPAGRLLFVNREGLEQFGYSQADVDAGMNIGETLAVEDRAAMGPALARVLAGETAVARPYTARRKDGSLFPVLIYAAPIRREGEEIVGVRGAVIDITARVAAEEEHARLEEQLQRAQRLESLGVLAGGIAHDFNNVLAVIVGHCELASDEVAPGSAGHEHLVTIHRAANRARDLVRQILAFSRQAEGDLVPVDLLELADETRRFVRASLPSSIEVRTEFDEGPLTILGDATQIHQVLVNLCANAAHAMRGKAGLLEIAVEAVHVGEDRPAVLQDLAPGPHARLSVRDNGHGMPPEVCERIFEPFFTTKGPGEGTGLGLSTVYGIVAGHHGAIEVESVVGEGSTFRIWLPCTDRTAARPDDLAPHAPPGRGEHILAVDDEAPLLAVVSSQLTRLGYRVSAVADPREAARLFADAPAEYDLLVTDLTMPGMTGQELALAVRRARPDLGVLLMSGSANVVAGSPEAAEADAVLSKPFNSSELARAVQAVLSGRARAEDREG